MQLLTSRISFTFLLILLLAININVSKAQDASEKTLPLHHNRFTNGVKINDLVESALAANPEITIMRREFDAARARIPQAKALPDPVVSFGNVNVGSPIPFLRTTDDFNENFNFGFSQEFPWFGIRRLHGQIAGAEADAKFQEYQIMVRKLTADVKIAAYDLYNIDRALAIISRDKDILEKLAQVSEARYAVGKAQQVDLINAHLEITDLLDKEGNLEAKRIGVVARLNNLLFRDPETPIEAIADFQISPEPPSLEALVQLAEKNAPDLAQQKRLIEMNNHAIRLAERAAKYPEVGLQFNYHNRTPDFPSFYSYQVNLKIPLYAFTKQRYAIEEQTANLAAARAKLASTNSMIRYKLRDARIRATTAARLIRLHEQGLIPQSSLALESSMSAYQVGQVDFLTLLTALKRSLDYETHYYEMVTDYQKALTEMEAFVGVELTR